MKKDVINSDVGLNIQNNYGSVNAVEPVEVIESCVVLIAVKAARSMMVVTGTWLSVLPPFLLAADFFAFCCSLVFLFKAASLIP